MAPWFLDYFADLSEGLEQHHLVWSNHSPATAEVHGQQDEGEQVLYKNHSEFSPIVWRALQGRIINILLVLRSEFYLLEALLNLGHVAVFGFVIRCRDLVVQELLIH